jgi:hypothetical protein
VTYKLVSAFTGNRLGAEFIEWLCDADMDNGHARERYIVKFEDEEERDNDASN